MAEDNIYVGKDLGWRELDTSPAAVEEYIAVSSDDNAWYRSDSPFGAPVLPATFFHFQAFRHNPGWFPSVTYGTLFARLRWQWARPLIAGEPARSHAWISEILRKGERWHITCDVDIYGPGDAIAIRTRTTQTFLVDTEYRGLVRAPDTVRQRRTSASPVPDGTGSIELTPLKRFVTVEMCERFFGGTRNYHTDTEESKKMGFGDIVVGGPMSVCYIGDMLTRNVGRDLFIGSDLDIRFVDILWPNNEITVAGRRLAEPIPELNRDRYPFHVEICDPTGRTTVVANGSYVLRNSA
jgi:hypothetical protein